MTDKTNPQSIPDENTEMKEQQPIIAQMPEPVMESEPQDEKLLQEAEAEEPSVKEFSQKTYYEEPLRLSGRDMAGVILAMVMLTIIGIGGYIWLTPGLSVSGGADHHNHAMQADAGRDHSTGTDEGQTHEAHAQMAAAPAEHSKCAWCGMFADKSMGRVKATFAEGSDGDFDSWGCVFHQAEDTSTSIASAEVVCLDSSLEEPEWLTADSSWFLYKMDERVEGSMPPYIGAWSDRETALERKAVLGGELVDYAGLTEKMNEWLTD